MPDKRPRSASSSEGDDNSDAGPPRRRLCLAGDSTSPPKPFSVPKLQNEPSAVEGYREGRLQATLRESPDKAETKAEADDGGSGDVGCMDEGDDTTEAMKGAAGQSALAEEPLSHSPDLFSPLSDEIMVRLMSNFGPRTLLSLSLVSRRLHQLSADSQVWRNLYHRHFVWPGPMRFPVFRYPMAAPQARLRLPPPDHDPADVVDWKRMYKISYSWLGGSCVKKEMRLGDATQSPLLKVVDGLAVTADAAFGLRAWDLRGRELLAQVDIRVSDGEPGPVPTFLAVDDQVLRQPKSLDVCVGFSDGTFGLWTCDVPSRRIFLRYMHQASADGNLLGVAYSSPYIMTAAATASESVHISLYAFDTTRQCGDGSDISPLPPPALVQSLKSLAVCAPVTLSIRKTPLSTIASVIFTSGVRGGWSIGIEELILPAPGSVQDLQSKVHSRLATTQLKKGVHPCYDSRPPTYLRYSHPYLLAILGNNTMVRYLCTSTEKALSVSHGQQLWGHTSRIADAGITSRGKAVTTNQHGDHLMVWYLEGRAPSIGIDILPRDLELEALAKNSNSLPGDIVIGDDGCDSRAEFSADDEAGNVKDGRNWVDFDDEMIVILKESREGKGLMVYDFS